VFEKQGSGATTTTTWRQAAVTKMAWRMMVSFDLFQLLFFSLYVFSEEWMEGVKF